MPRLFRHPKPTIGFQSAQIDDARFILNGGLGKVNARGKFFSAPVLEMVWSSRGTGRAALQRRVAANPKNTSRLSAGDTAVPCRLHQCLKCSKWDGPRYLHLSSCGTTLPCGLWCREWAGHRSRWATRLRGRSQKVCWYCWELGRKTVTPTPAILRKK